jgi:hypothetical protein
MVTLSSPGFTESNRTPSRPPSPPTTTVLQRFTGRRELLPETINAIAGLVSGKSAGLTW